jgi:hypothetical protein
MPVEIVHAQFRRQLRFGIGQYESEGCARHVDQIIESENGSVFQDKGQEHERNRRMAQVQRQIGKSQRKGVIIPEMHKARNRRRRKNKISEIGVVPAQKDIPDDNHERGKSQHKNMCGRHKIVYRPQPAAEQIEQRGAVRRENEIERAERNGTQDISPRKVKISFAQSLCQLAKSQRKRQHALDGKLNLAEAEGGQTYRADKGVNILTEKNHIDKVHRGHGVSDNVLDCAVPEPGSQNESKHAHLSKRAQRNEQEIQPFAENADQCFRIVKDVGHCQTQRKARRKNQRKYFRGDVPTPVG